MVDKKKVSVAEFLRVNKNLTVAGTLTAADIVVTDDQTLTDDLTVEGTINANGGLVTDTIAEETAAAGVTADGVLLKDGGVTLANATALVTDIISEKVAAAGVTIDTVLLKDGYSTGAREPLTLTATGAITAKKHGLAMLSHATVVIAATLAAPVAGDDLMIVNTSASGTVAHTVKAAAGVTFDGTNNTLTLDAPEEAVHIVALSATRWKIMENIGSVGLSST